MKHGQKNIKQPLVSPLAMSPSFGQVYHDSNGHLNPPIISSESLSSLMTRTETVLETLVSLPLNCLTRLLSRENSVDFSRRRSSKLQVFCFVRGSPRTWKQVTQLYKNDEANLWTLLRSRWSCHPETRCFSNKQLLATLRWLF